jgi:Sec-independent protein translocase protein TatA
VLGRKKLSTTSAGRVGTAIKTASGARKEAADVARAEQTAQKVQADLIALNAKLQHEIDELDTAFDAQAEPLDEIILRAKATDIHIPLVSLAWMPYSLDTRGRMRPAWG